MAHVHDVNVMSWDSIEEQFEGVGGALLLGNGFSMNLWSKFGYKTLREQSGLDGIALELFWDRFNFETVLEELTVTKRTVEVVTPDQQDLVKTVGDLADTVRAALLSAVSKVHPKANQLRTPPTPLGRLNLVSLPIRVLDELAEHLPKYARVFVTNYDLVSYWTSVQEQRDDLLRGSDPFDEVQAADLLRVPGPKVLFLHGALHLWRSLSTGAEGKHVIEVKANLLQTLRATLDAPDRGPLFISEGSAEEKSARISESPYLSFCLRTFADTDTPLTVLGQSLSDSDAHIRDAIEVHPDRPLAVGIWVENTLEGAPRREALVVRAKEFQGKLASCRDVVFFDSSEHPLTNPALHCGPSAE